jgi:hypothetical protein
VDELDEVMTVLVSDLFALPDNNRTTHAITPITKTIAAAIPIARHGIFLTGFIGITTAGVDMLL